MQTTVLPAESRPGYLEEVKQRVIDVISQQPGVPFSVILLAEIVGIAPPYIEAAFMEYDSFPSCETAGAFLLLSGASRQIIYIP